MKKIILILLSCTVFTSCTSNKENVSNSLNTDIDNNNTKIILNENVANIEDDISSELVNEEIDLDDKNDNFVVFNDERYGIEFLYPGNFEYNLDEMSGAQVFTSSDDENLFFMFSSPNQIGTIDEEIKLRQSFASSFELVEKKEDSEGYFLKYIDNDIIRIVYENSGEFFNSQGTVNIRMVFGIPMEYQNNYTYYIEKIINSVNVVEISKAINRNIFENEYFSIKRPDWGDITLLEPREDVIYVASDIFQNDSNEIVNLMTIYELETGQIDDAWFLVDESNDEIATYIGPGQIVEYSEGYFYRSYITNAGMCVYVYGQVVDTNKAIVVSVVSNAQNADDIAEDILGTLEIK